MSRGHRILRSFLPFTLVLPLIAGTTLGDGDVAIVANASATPVTLVREAPAGSATITVLADEGSINATNCDGSKNAVWTFGPWTWASAGLTAGATEIKDAFDCHNYSSGTDDEASLTVAVSAAATAPLGRSAPSVTFGGIGGGALVTHGGQISLRTTDGDGETPFTNPVLHIVVNPRPASSLTATAGDGEVTLSWTASPDDADLTAYDIAGDANSSVAAGTTSTTVTGLTNDTEVCFTVTARHTDATPEHFRSTATNEACATPTGTVVVDNFSATFKSPIDSGGVINVAKQGRTVPVKTAIKNNGVAIPADSRVSLRMITTGECATGSSDSVEVYASGGPNAGNQFRWDETGGFWIYNLATGALPVNSCWRGNVYVGGDLSDSTVTGGTLAGSFLIKVTK